MSDEGRCIATPLGVLARNAGTRGLVDDIERAARRDGVVEVVVGLPLNADGTAGVQARKARALADVLRKVLEVPVRLWEEGSTTVEAIHRLREAGHGRHATGRVDAEAAAVFLQDYLDASGADRPVAG